MDRELECEIVRDLLPLYVDKMASDVSKESIRRHLEHCADCNEIYRRMTFHLEEEKRPSEVGDVKRFLNKTKRMFLFYGLCGLSVLSILICMIVDLAVNKKITWSLIVDCAALFSDAFAYTALTCRKNKGFALMGVISVGTFCLLTAIQISLYYLMDTGTIWIFRYGYPIMLFWLGAVWIPVLLRTFLKWNLWDCGAVLFLLALIGNYVTNLITRDYVWKDIFEIRYFINNGLGDLLGAVLFWMLGRVKKLRK